MTEFVKPRSAFRTHRPFDSLLHVPPTCKDPPLDWPAEHDVLQSRRRFLSGGKPLVYISHANYQSTWFKVNVDDKELEEVTAPDIKYKYIPFSKEVLCKANVLDDPSTWEEGVSKASDGVPAVASIADGEQGILLWTPYRAALSGPGMDRDILYRTWFPAHLLKTIPTEAQQKMFFESPAENIKPVRWERIVSPSLRIDAYLPVYPADMQRYRGEEPCEMRATSPIRLEEERKLREDTTNPLLPPVIGIGVGEPHDVTAGDIGRDEIDDAEEEVDSDVTVEVNPYDIEDFLPPPPRPKPEPISSSIEEAAGGEELGDLDENIQRMRERQRVRRARNRVLQNTVSRISTSTNSMIADIFDDGIEHEGEKQKIRRARDRVLQNNSRISTSTNSMIADIFDGMDSDEDGKTESKLVNAKIETVSELKLLNEKSRLKLDEEVLKREDPDAYAAMKAEQERVRRREEKERRREEREAERRRRRRRRRRHEEEERERHREKRRRREREEQKRREERELERERRKHKKEEEERLAEILKQEKEAMEAKQLERDERRRKRKEAKERRHKQREEESRRFMAAHTDDDGWIHRDPVRKDAMGYGGYDDSEEFETVVHAPYAVHASAYDIGVDSRPFNAVPVSVSTDAISYLRDGGSYANVHHMLTDPGSLAARTILKM